MDNYITGAAVKRLREARRMTQAQLAQRLGVELQRVSVKATTEEGLGFTGSGQGISSQAICLLTSPFNLALEDAASSKCQGCSGCRKA